VSIQPTLRERCFDALLRVNRIVHLDTMTADSPDSDVLDFLTANVGVLAEHYGWDNDPEELDEDDIQDGLADEGATGWIIEASTPERDHWPYFSWGLTTFKAFYGETYEEALEKAFTWVAAMGQDRYEQPDGAEAVPAESGAATTMPEAP
jgi:hypothetical protein